MRIVAGARTAIVVLVIATTTALGAAVFSTGAGAGTDHSPGAPTHLTVDDDTAPLAVEGAPQFGWVVHDPDRGEVQTAYEIVVRSRPSATKAAKKIVWRSGEVRSSQQSYVTAPSLGLASDGSYSWMVRTWDRNGGRGPFSKPAPFDVGITDNSWHADWIRRPGAPATAVEDFSLFRKDVVAGASRIVRARAYLSAGQQYDLRVNGTRVAHGPSFSYPDEGYYEATDITRQLVAGKTNAIGVVTHWSTPGQGRPPSVPGLIARITIEHADGSHEVVTTDGSWRSHAGPWIQGAPRNDEGDFVEHIDARLDPVGWDRPGFDHSWDPAHVIGAHPVAPFLHLYAARTHIVEHAMPPVTFKRMANGAYVAGFGSVIAATPVVELHAGVAGRDVKIVAGYLLDPDGHVSTTKGTQQTDMHWDYTERSGAQEVRPFGYLGYRYLEVIGAGETMKSRDVVAYARHASMPDERAATFKTSNPAVDAVWNLARHSTLYASQEQFVDTPTREKGAFMDPYDSAATMAAFGDRAMTFEALRDFARSQKRYWPDGRVNVVYPNGDGRRDIPDSTEQYVEWVWQVYETTGNRAQLASLYPVAKNISDYVNRAIDPKTGLVTNLPGGGGDYLYGLVDWPPQMRFGYDVATAARTTENIQAVDVFRRVAAMARELERPAGEARTEQERATRLTTAIESHLRRPDGVLVDGLEANGGRSKHASQLANAYALAFGLVPAAQVKKVSDYVVNLGNSVGVSTFSNLLVALHATGRDDAFVTALSDPSRPGYARILDEGATFIWESWDARQTGDSESHAWGSTVLTTLQEDILGVDVTAPGAAHVTVRTPSLTPMQAKGVVATERGSISISWDRSAPHRFSLDVKIPANVVATLHVPAAHVGQVSDGHRSLIKDPGVLSVRASRGEVVLTVGSGRYELHEPALAPSSIPRFPWTLLVLAAIGALAFAALAVMTIERRRAQFSRY